MISFSTDNIADADTDSALGSDSEEYDTDGTLSPEDVQGVLEEANAGMKPGLGDKSIIAYQAYDEDDVSRHMILLETRGLEKTFQTQPDGVVSLRNHAQRTEWRERLVTYSILLESNMFSPSIDIVGTDEKQTFLYNFVVATSPLSRMSIARKFKRDMGMPLLDVGTIAQPPAKRLRKSSIKDLLEATKQLENRIVTLKPAPKPERAFDAAQGVAAAEQLDFRFVTLTPATEQQEAPTPATPAEPTPEPEAFEAAQGVAAAEQLDFKFVTLAPVQAPEEPAPEATAPAPEPDAEATPPTITVGQGLKAAEQLGFEIVTLKKQ